MSLVIDSVEGHGKHVVNTSAGEDQVMLHLFQIFTRWNTKSECAMWVTKFFIKAFKMCMRLLYTLFGNRSVLALLNDKTSTCYVHL